MDASPNCLLFAHKFLRTSNAFPRIRQSGEFRVPPLALKLQTGTAKFKDHQIERLVDQFRLILFESPKVYGGTECLLRSPLQRTASSAALLLNGFTQIGGTKSSWNPLAKIGSGLGSLLHGGCQYSFAGCSFRHYSIPNAAGRGIHSFASARVLKNALLTPGAIHIRIQTNGSTWAIRPVWSKSYSFVRELPLP